MINFPLNYWLVDVNALPAFDPAKPRTRAIRVGPLVDMAALQTVLNSGSFDLDNLWIATDKCERDLSKESWKVSDVLQMLACLHPQQDYRKSEWCQVLGGGMVPCDVYVTRYDAERQQRHPRGLEVYLKFSIDDGGQLTIVMVSCHA